MEERILDEPAAAVEHHKDVEKYVETVCEPEGLEDMAAGVLSGEHVHNDDNQGQDDAGKA